MTAEDDGTWLERLAFAKLSYWRAVGAFRHRRFDIFRAHAYPYFGETLEHLFAIGGL